ncbi:solute carrier family 12 member 4-like isoform X2 [Ruditapes philippinarum]|uniref:solute carrier family 12 member 4-like isoform X2 n=1 Tax=Ruditapes philippinarum TaxID=129788 RepID=UPI00295AD491|nr:solute carrier family 12 member 4-like isoform X2 [Ruditapes philippinarum]
MSEVRDRFTVVKAEDDDVFENKATPDGSDVKKGILQENDDNDAPGKETTPLTDGMVLYEEDIVTKGTMSTLLKRSPTKVSFCEQVDEVEDTSKKKKLGTLFGVYLPTIQNIFGVLIFIRVTWIVGMAGTIEGFLIIFLCCCTTTLTSISMSAIATNGIVPAGGSYFMISRALGPEFGGAVGILFYLGFTVAGSMYVIGAIEILVTFIAPQISLFGDVTELSNALNNYRLFGTILLLLLFLICFIGVEFVAKFGPFSLFCVVFSIICIYIGIFVASPETSVQICFLGDRLLTLSSVSVDGVMMCTKNETGPIFNNYCSLNALNETVCDPYFLENNVTLRAGMPGLASGNFFKNIPHRYTEKGNLIGLSEPGNRERGEIIADLTSTFTVLLAIYFPSVTGIMTGSNMSGDLEDAQKSIPGGTLAAVLSTSAVYLSCVLFFAAGIEGDLLRDKLGESIGGGLVIAYTAWPTKWMVLIGSFLSTIGAGLQSINGAPRLLYAIANDNIIPFLRVFGRTRRGEPFLALVLTVAIAQAGVLVGNLDYVTPIITMFFLMCYLFVNLACALQTLLRSPSWRPRYRFYHWTLSLLGVGLCATLMVISSWYYALVAFAMAGGIYKYIEYKGAEKEWGDGIRGMAMSLARYSLLKVQQTPPHAKNWRPQIILLCKLDENLNPKYERMIHFASQLKAGKGLTLISCVLEGVFEERKDDVRQVKQNLQQTIDRIGVKGFKDVVVAKDRSIGCSHLVQTAGLGGLKPNTVLLGWPYSWKHGTNDKRFKPFIDTIQCVVAADMALLVFKGAKGFPTSSEKVKGTIDVWWIVQDGGLLVLLPYLLRQHKTWKNCKLRIFSVAQMSDNNIQMKKDLKAFMYKLRIEADIDVVDMQHSDISPDTYERTLQMEQRIEMMKKMKEASGADDTVVPDVTRKQSKEETKIDLDIQTNGDVLDTEEISQFNQYTFTPTTRGKAHTVEEIAENVNKNISEILVYGKEPPKSGNTEPDEKNVKRMHTAVKLNELIQMNSKGSQLVIVNLPPPPKASDGEIRSLQYMEFLEVLTEGIDRVLMVRGSGSEVITIYS